MENETEYFRRVLTVLLDKRRIYDFPVTSFITSKVWTHIPFEWIQALKNIPYSDLHKVPYGLIEDDWPETLKVFLTEAANLAVQREQIPAFPVEISNVMRKGMSAKKQHEVSFMAKIVDEKCKETGCKHVIDVGSGLGYLGHVLSGQCGYSVLGLECEEARTHGADKLALAKDLGEGSLESFSFTLEDNPTSISRFRDLLVQHIANKKANANRTQSTSCVKSKSCNGTTDLASEQHQGSGHGSKHGAEAASCTDNDIQNISNSSCTTKPVYNHRTCSNCNCCESERSLNLKHGDVTENVAGPVKTNDSFRAYNTDSAPEYTESKHTPEKDKQKCVNSIEPVAMVGLHCCGDLTPVMLKVFASSPELRCLVCFSCCYHNMSQIENGIYTQFPLSQCLQNVYSSFTAQNNWCISTYGLRLAAQETRSRWNSQTEEDHEFHIRNVGYRGILDLYAKQLGITFEKNKRKLARRGDFKDFDTYVDAILTRINIPGDIESHKEKLKLLYEECKQWFEYIEVFTCLQVVLQSVLESLILMDRKIYLQEQNIDASLVPVFDEYLSPRNIAIVATKS